MKSFTKKKVVEQNSLGGKLKKARQNKGLSLEDVAKKTGVQQKHLHDIEEANYSDTPGDIYVRAWIRQYADFLEIDSQDLIVDYKIEKGINDKISDKKDKGSALGLKSNMWPASKIVRYIAIVIVALSVLVYLAFEIKNIISPPNIEISFPASNYRTIENSIDIVGKTEPEVILTINNESVLLEDDGVFQEKINLVIGLNNLEISVKKKHSRTKTIDLIIYRESLE